MGKIRVDDLQRIVSDGKKIGYDLRIADIFYVFDLQRFESKNVVYTVLFGKTYSNDNIEKYDNSDKIKFLKRYISSNYPIDGFPLKFGGSNKGDKAEIKQYEDITFEENKEALIKLLERTQQMAKEGKIEEKDAIKIQSDIRLKLNNYFNVSEKQDEQRVIVYKKYTDICICGREIYKPTRDDIIEDLKDEYDLVPKKDNRDERDNKTTD